MLPKQRASPYTPASKEDADLDHPEHEKPSAAMRRVEMADFRDDVSGYLRQVREGASFLITADGAAVAELRPPPAEPEAERPAATTPEPAPGPRRLAGRLKGKIWMADDWDTWPEGFIESMTEGPIFPAKDKGE